MQPYFFPYIGYFQLIAAVDRFVVHDRVKYTKKGWINRNRILQQGVAHWLSLPLKAAPDALDIGDRELAADFDARRLVDQIAGAYRPAPHFRRAMPVIEACLRDDERRLFPFLLAALRRVCDYLSIRTPLIPASEVAIDPGLRAQSRVIAICAGLGADAYLNPIGGTSLYSAAEFGAAGIELGFLESVPVPYPQFGGDFVPSLSIVDVMMFNPVERIADMLVTACRVLPGAAVAADAGAAP